MITNSQSLVLVLLSATVLASAVASGQDLPRATGSISGTVRVRATQQPIEGASVVVEGTTLGAVSDAQGRYRIAAVVPGTYRVRAIRLGYTPTIVGDVLVTARRTFDAPIEMDDAPPVLSATQVVAAAFARPADVPTTSYTLSYEEVRRSPGAIGDVTRLVQALPGVITASDQRNDLIARGGSPMENITLVDHVEIPNANHFAAQNTSGGPITMINNELLQDVTFLAGGLPARVGNRLSSALDLRMREGNRRERQSEIDISFAGGGVVTEGPIGRPVAGRGEARGSYVASVRRSYLNFLAGPFGLTAIPNYWNWQAKGVYDLTPKDRVVALALGGTDNISFAVDTADREDPSLEDIRQRGWRAAHGITWRHLYGGGYGVLTLSDFRTSFRVQVNDSRLGDQLVFRNASLEDEQTLKYDHVQQVGPLGELAAGLSWKRMGADFDLAQPLGAENPLSATAPRSAPLTIRRDIATSLLAGYGQLSRDLPLGAMTMTLTAGARAEQFTFFDATRVSPRLGAVWHVRPMWDVSTSVSRHFQQVPLVYAAASPGNAALAPIRADQLVAGLAWTPTPDVRLSVEGFAKRYVAYPVATEYPTLSLANTGDVFGVNGLLFPMTSLGTGSATGLELFAQKKFDGGWYGQLASTWSRTEHSALDGVRRRSAFDVPFTGTAILGVKRGTRWEYSTRFSYASGRPFTPILAGPSAVQNRLVLDLTRVNAERSPAYARWDMRADRRFTMWGRTAVTYLEIQNVLNRENVLLFQWNPKVGTLQAVNQIAFLPVGGFNVEF